MPLKSSVSKFLLLFTAALLISSCQPTSHIDQRQKRQKITWHQLIPGRMEAAKSHKPCLVDFYYGPTCPRCSMFDKQIYNNPKVISRLNRDFIAIRIDLRQPLNKEEQALADTMQTNGECMLMFLNEDGKVIKTKGGNPICTMDKITRQQFMYYLDQAINNLPAVSK
ncbi:MAG TPA: thioredoxin family protein [Desulfobacterales bacterium]|nr:thioredoxin family protein [Desulfobacterales bacterium]